MNVGVGHWAGVGHFSSFGLGGVLVSPKVDVVGSGLLEVALAAQNPGLLVAGQNGHQVGMFAHVSFDSSMGWAFFARMTLSTTPVAVLLSQIVNKIS